MVATNFMRETMDVSVLLSATFFFAIAAKNAWQGCQTTLEAILTDQNVNGKYLSDCRETWIYSRKWIGNKKAEKTVFKEVRRLLRLNQESANE